MPLPRCHSSFYLKKKKKQKTKKRAQLSLSLLSLFPLLSSFGRPPFRPNRRSPPLAGARKERFVQTQPPLLLAQRTNPTPCSSTRNTSPAKPAAPPRALHEARRFAQFRATLSSALPPCAGLASPLCPSSSPLLLALS